MNIIDINIDNYLHILREQSRQEKRDKAKKIQKNKDLNKLAKEVLKLKKLGVI